MAKGQGCLSITAGSIASFIKFKQPHLYSDATIVRNYLSLAFVLIAMVLIARGAYGLYSTLRKQKSLQQGLPYWIAGPIALACVYTWLLTNQNYGETYGNVEFLPEWILVITIALPYVFTWCIGIMAAIYLYHYKNKVKGSIYKRALGNISLGVGFIIGTSVLVRFITTLSERVDRLNLTPLLTLLYFLVALYAVGFGLVARGAKKLKQIEDV